MKNKFSAYATTSILLPIYSKTYLALLPFVDAWCYISQCDYILIYLIYTSINIRYMMCIYATCMMVFIFTCAKYTTVYYTHRCVWLSGIFILLPICGMTVLNMYCVLCTYMYVPHTIVCQLIRFNVCASKFIIIIIPRNECSMGTSTWIIRWGYLVFSTVGVQDFPKCIYTNNGSEGR